MKVTAIIPDDLIAEAMALSKAETITETLKIALHAYIRTQKLKELGNMILSEPLEFKYTSQELRELNRK